MTVGNGDRVLVVNLKTILTWPNRGSIRGSAKGSICPPEWLHRLWDLPTLQQVIGLFSAGVKRLGREACRLPPSGADGVKIKYTVMSREQRAGQIQNMNIANKSFQNVQSSNILE